MEMKVPEYFASMVFDDAVMQERLPKETYRALKKTAKDGRSLDISIANVVANAMKDWAIEKGATHYTHWFQPMTGVTAEKHDSFISPTDAGGVIMEFSGKELVRGEPDASSFPSGGLRATFEARGYTAWDATSYAFIKDGALCIPTAFCSYGGEALDKKTPLLRSMEALNRQAMRILRLFGNETVTNVKTTVGPEQEYFLIPEDMFNKRRDLVYTGRTLFGARSPKGQELDDHYFGAIKPKVSAFMRELDEELWKLGVFAKTEHNEVAPSQHELAPVFTTTNIACDHNQLAMEMMQKIARKHGMVCLLHEKPFAGVNGSGKHNNWSISTNTGTNLLEPGETPHENAQFLLFLVAVIKAVDDYQDLLRISVASASNDHRLGAQEAPPAVVSIFLGEELDEILSSIENGTAYDAREEVRMRVGVHTLPKFPRDTTDRNRTSPFAFTGNKFEFRMVGSSQSLGMPNTVLNTIVAESLSRMADALEAADDRESAWGAMMAEQYAAHSRVLFNGNNYDAAWTAEAARRGLPAIDNTVDAVDVYGSEQARAVLNRHGVLSDHESLARREIALQNYATQGHIEAVTMVKIARQTILPACARYSGVLADAAAASKQAGVAAPAQTAMLRDLNRRMNDCRGAADALDEAMRRQIPETAFEQAVLHRDELRPRMEKLRAAVDALECIVDKAYWPLPSYGEMLFRIV